MRLDLEHSRSESLIARFARLREVRLIVILCFLIILSMSTVSSIGQAAATGGPPNVVVILADDLGYSDLGCYGGEIQTPNLDRLAHDGLRFSQFYNTARCWPTRSAFLTGYYAQQIRRDTLPGIRSGGQGTRPAWARLLPEMLKPLGYRSYHSGKWHVDGMPVQGGFDLSYMLQDGRFFNPRAHFENDRKLPPVEPGTGFYSTTAIADHAIEHLKDHAANHPDRPFFQFVAFLAPHFPLQAPPEDIARYLETFTSGWDEMRQRYFKRQLEMGLVKTSLSGLEREVGPPYHFPDDLAILGPDEVNRPLPWGELSASQQRFQATKMAIHAAMVDRMDQEIGRIIQQLQAMGVMENTLILFYSDNGASAEIMVRDAGHDPKAPPGSAATHLCLGPGWSSASNTPFRRHKTWVHEGGISTPLIAHWPEGIKARGEIRHDAGHVVDLVPTIMDVAGGKAPAAWEGKPVPPPPGKSLAPALAVDGSVKHEYLWWLHEGNRAISVGDWKLVAAGEEGPWELYDLSKDRAETMDLSKQNPEKARELAAKWTSLYEEFRKLASADLPAGEPAKEKAKAKAKVKAVDKKAQR